MNTVKWEIVRLPNSANQKARITGYKRHGWEVYSRQPNGEVNMRRKIAPTATIKSQ